MEELFALLGFAMILIFIIPLLILIGGYIFFSIAYYSISKKLGQSSPGLAWIPIIGPPLILTNATGLPLWPFIATFVASATLPFFSVLSFFFSISKLGWMYYLGYYFISIILSTILSAYTIFLHWKTFEKLNIPNWFSILLLVPIANIVVICIAAWGKQNQQTISQNPLPQQNYASPQGNVQ